LRTLLGRSTHPNLFDVHPPFQIDGNFGGCAGIAEMLLQSHLNEIELLPALPKAWEQGRMRGIRARGGLELDLSWKGGKLEQLKILAHRAGTWKLRAAGKVQEIQLDSGESREFSY
jgi:alpha-L-fucosidase 2